MFYFFINHKYIKTKQDVFVLSNEKTLKYCKDLASKNFNKFIYDISIYDKISLKDKQVSIIDSFLEVNEVLFLKNDYIFIRNSILMLKKHYSCSKFDKNILKIGVTGTNGKTSVVHYLSTLFTLYSKHKSISVGTNGVCLYKNGKFKTILSLENTTPSFDIIYHLLTICLKKQYKLISFEVSSHALDQNRINDIIFDSSIFTNLTQDHLDYHKDMNRYAYAKSILFSKHSNSDTFCIMNYDSEHFDKMLQKSESKKIIKYGNNLDSDYIISNLHYNDHKINYTLTNNKNIFDIKTNSMGTFQSYNITAALLTLSYTLKVDLKYFIKHLDYIENPAGRFFCKISKGITYCVDYAHTPDALENVLKSIRQSYMNEKKSDSKLITIIGCGGERDSTKRPIMGAIAEKYSDFIVITDDNPRNEDPCKIRNDIADGVINKQTIINHSLPRKEAIIFASRYAKKGYFILIAGKGNENYQIIGDKKFDYSDNAVIDKL